MAGVPHRREADAKCSVSWERKVNSELFVSSTKHEQPGSGNQAKPEKKGRWDPYDTFTTKEEFTKFFSGHGYRQHHLIDRERVAKFAIEKTLEDHPDDKFEITGEVMKNEFVTDQSLDDVERAIRADGQRDVDVEVPTDHTTHASRAKKNESAQKVSAAAQSIVAASPNCLGPPVGPCAAYLKMAKCGQYGRSDSTVWTSPFIPTLDNTDGRRGLLDHQVTAIVWLLSRLFGDLPKLTYEDPCTKKMHSNITNSFDESNRDRLKGPRYFGGILADSMGLGKTLITVALIYLLIRQKLNVGVREDGTPKHRPILLIAPNATVASQWAQEFNQVIDKSVLLHIIVSGPGLEELSCDDSDRVTYLERDEFRQWPWNLKYIWNENDPRASQVVLIMTMESWAARTCTKDKGEWTSSFTKQGRGFSLVIVDEAFKVKNPNTRNWRSVYLLKRQFTLLITATPCMNSLTDLFGLARLLWTTPNEYLEQNPEQLHEINKIVKDETDLEKLDNYPLSHNIQLVAGRPALLAKLLFKRRGERTQDISLTCKYLKYFETLAMLKRSPSSYLYSDWEKTKSISLEGLFPKVENYTVDISIAEADNQEYQRVHIDLLIDYLEGLKDWGSGSGKRQGKSAKKVPKKQVKKEIKDEDEEEEKGSIIHSLRLLQLASSSLDVYDLNTILKNNGHSTLATKVAEMREGRVNLPRLVQFLAPSNGPLPDTHVGWMKLAARKSPVLRYILHYINEKVLTREENGPIKKLLLIEQNPMLAFFYELALQFLGIECRCMHAQLSLDERQKLVDSFNSSKHNSCQILIQMYTVGFAGTNLHKSCSQVLVASQSYSLPVQWQAIYRVIRVGQSSDVTVHRVKLKNSFHTFRESRQIEKILPELGARAQGDTKKILVRLLNLFQYEVRNAWESPEGQKLLMEKNLLEDDKCNEAEGPTPKKVKLENEAQCKVGNKRIKTEDEGDFLRNIFSKFVSGKPNTDAKTSSSSTKRGQQAIVPKTGDGSGGWYHNEDPIESDTNSFLQLRTRDQYYGEFIGLPREARSLFSYEKNNLRRMLSYGNDNGSLSTAQWAEADLDKPAVLERALELMLRVRLGASDIAMLPFPMINLSSSHGPRRQHLQRLLAEMTHTDQDYDQPTPVASVNDLRESQRGFDVTKSLDEIEKDLENQAKFGDLDSGGRRAAAKAPRQIITDQNYNQPTPVASVNDLRESQRGFDVTKSLDEIEKGLENQAKFGDLDSGGGRAAAKAPRQIISLASSSDHGDDNVVDSINIDRSISDDIDTLKNLDAGGNPAKSRGKEIAVLDDEDKDEERDEMNADSIDDDEVIFVSHKNIKGEKYESSLV
ncbi:P-loop containing nucleoside triphosphate hydrolase protein [Xylaria telfairii]|nr:P-loop containing nucleoside triphosphate hydrolase protein [Xylaria telfairii]